MSNGFLSSSKNTLVFAGGVLFVSAMIAGSFAQEPTPGDADLASDDNAIAAQSAQPAPRPAKRASDRPSQSAEPAISFDDWIDDDSLIDDTTGFSTDPGDEVSVIKRETSSRRRQRQSENEDEDDDLGYAEEIE